MSDLMETHERSRCNGQETQAHEIRHLTMIRSPFVLFASPSIQSYFYIKQLQRFRVECIVMCVVLNGPGGKRSERVDVKQRVDYPGYIEYDGQTSASWCVVYRFCVFVSINDILSNWSRKSLV